MDVGYIIVGLVVGVLEAFLAFLGGAMVMIMIVMFMMMK